MPRPQNRILISLSGSLQTDSGPREKSIGTEILSVKFPKIWVYLARLSSFPEISGNVLHSSPEISGDLKQNFTSNVKHSFLLCYSQVNGIL